MAMMTLVIASIVHFSYAATTASGATSLADSESAAIVLEVSGDSVSPCT